VAELVAGVDGCKRGWVAVVLLDGRFREARLLEGVESSFAELADMKRIAIDVPIG
jgi:predicted RNase H-like nuclease